MDCSDCGEPAVAFAVPPDLREHAPGGAGAARICTRCLRVEAAGDDPPGDPPAAPSAASFSAVIEAFPDGEAGVALALALGLLPSLALNRGAIEALLGRVERAGADPLLALDRLAVAGSVAPAFDLDRRRTQVRDFLE